MARYPLPARKDAAMSILQVGQVEVRERRPGRSMTWDATSRTPSPPFHQAGDLGGSRFAHETSRHHQEQGGMAAGGEAATAPVDGLISEG
jgi:hypothetical protein